MSYCGEGLGETVEKQMVESSKLNMRDNELPSAERRYLFCLYVTLLREYPASHWTSLKALLSL